MNSICGNLIDPFKRLYSLSSFYKASRSVLVQLETLDSFTQVELVQVVKSHQVPVPSENKHLTVINRHALPVTRARLLSDYEPMGLVIHDLLLQLLVSGLLIPNRL